MPTCPENRPPRGKAALPVVLRLRRQAGVIAALCDSLLLGQQAYAREQAQAGLPTAIRRLLFRAQRALTALEENRP